MDLWDHFDAWLEGIWNDGMGIALWQITPEFASVNGLHENLTEFWYHDIVLW